MIRFLLDDEEIRLGDDVPADLTVLDWLRLHRHRTGTKEGCGSGDCGACTVVVVSPGSVEPGEPPLRYESINACIAFVGALHGCQLLTVESLAAGDELHPAQRALVDEHGSQCGFCTPGFVMSMVALGESPDAPTVRWVAGDRPGANDGPAPAPTATPLAESRSPAVAARVSEAARGASDGDANGAANDAHADAVVTGTHAGASRPVTRPGGWLAGFETPDAGALSHRIDRALGGNLCRCTGYRPIKRAAAAALASHRPLRDGAAAQALVARLRALGGETTGPFHVPPTLDALARLRAEYPDAPLLAGGTDLALEITQRMRTLPRIVLVTRVPELQRLERVGDALHVGAAVTLNRLVEAFAGLVPDAPELLLRFGSDQVRNAGTLGGNLGSASPIGDCAPLLLALGARVVLQRGDVVREVPLDDYFVGYRRTVLAAGEFIREVIVPLPADDALVAVHKVSKRMDDDISAVCAAFHLSFEQADRGAPRVATARIACGGMAEVPKRASRVEAALVGRPFDGPDVERAVLAFAADFTPIDDARASAAYRLDVAANLLRRTYIEHAARAADAADAARGLPRPAATHWPGARLDDGWIRPPTRISGLEERFIAGAWRGGDGSNTGDVAPATVRTGTGVLDARRLGTAAGEEQ